MTTCYDLINGKTADEILEDFDNMESRIKTLNSRIDTLVSAGKWFSKAWNTRASEHEQHEAYSALQDAIRQTIDD